jgi:hypothetical protein
MTKSEYINEIKPKELRQILDFLDKLLNPPALMIFGVPGIGKTTIVNKFAEDKNYELRVKHLSRMDPTDWTGIPKNDPNDPYTAFRPISLFKPSEKKLVLFFDEINTALPQVLNSALDVILEKKADTGTYGKEAELPKNTIIVAAGNLGPEEDGTYVEEFSSAVKTRLIQVILKQSFEDWKEWAKNNMIHNYVIDFLENHQDYLVDINGFKQNLQQIATPRGWERISDYINNMNTEKDIEILKNLIIGTIGKKIGTEFINYIEQRKIDIPENLNKKINSYINLFNNPSVREIGKVSEYLKRTGEVFIIISNKIDLINRNKEIKDKVIELLKIIQSNFFNTHPNISLESLRQLHTTNSLRRYIIEELAIKEYKDIFDKVEKAS